MIRSSFARSSLQLPSLHAPAERAGSQRRAAQPSDLSPGWLHCMPLAFALLLALLPLGAAAASADAAVRIGVEGGVMGSGFASNAGLAPSGLARLRLALSDRLVLNLGAGVLRTSAPEDEPWTATLVPITLDLRLDRGPITPYVGAGIAWTHVLGDRKAGGDGSGTNPAPVADSLSAVVQAGLDVPLSERVAVGVQLVYAGLGATSASFGGATLLTAGISVGL